MSVALNRFMQGSPNLQCGDPNRAEIWSHTHFVVTSLVCPYPMSDLKWSNENRGGAGVVLTLKGVDSDSSQIFKQDMKRSRSYAKCTSASF